MLILRLDLTLCDENEAGEIYVRTPYLSSGYIGDPELTARRFVPNPFGSHCHNSRDVLYRTGDLATLVRTA